MNEFLSLLRALGLAVVAMFVGSAKGLAACQQGWGFIAAAFFAVYALIGGFIAYSLMSLVLWKPLRKKKDAQKIRQAWATGSAVVVAFSWGLYISIKG